MSLAEAFSPRHNSLAMMRLGLAGVVAVAHALTLGYGHQPSLGRTPLADLAVDGFFVVSGFLVTRSLLGSHSVGRYAWHRFLRLMPGFWVCLLLTALVAAPLAAVLAGRDPRAVFFGGDEPAWSYPLVNAGLPIFRYEIGGIATPRGEGAFNGSLWTLRYEALCYVVIAVLGVVALYRGRRWPVPALTAVVWIGALADAAGFVPLDVPVFDNVNVLRFLLVFLLGATAFVFAQTVPVHAGLAAIALGTVIAASFLPDYRLVAALPFAYLCLYGVVRLPLRWNPRWDLSYGLYVYHWPVQFLLVLAGLSGIGQWPFVCLSLAIALVLAALSWVCVEGPALRRKDALSRRTAPLDRRTAP